MQRNKTSKWVWAHERAKMCGHYTYVDSTNAIALRVILATKVFILTTVISINGTGETDLCTHHHVYHVLCATLAKTPFQMCSIVCSFTAFANLFPSVVCVRVYALAWTCSWFSFFWFIHFSLARDAISLLSSYRIVLLLRVSFYLACYAHLPFLYYKILNFSSSRHLVFVRKRHSFSLFASEHQAPCSWSLLFVKRKSHHSLWKF